MKIRAISVVSAAFLISVFASTSSAQQSAKEKTTPAEVAKMPFMNPELPTDKRVDDLIGRLTLEEKASQLVNQSRAIPRLGIPAYDWWSEALHGIAWNTATVFPEPIGLAATFDPAAIHDMTVAISTEGRAKYNMATRIGERRIFEGITYWSPNINIFRDPRWGRGQETYGEDPFLTSRLGVAFVTGIQGDDPKYLRAVATPKHFAVHSGPESTRHVADVPVSRHDQEDTYFPAFRATVIEGKAASVMCAYNSVNGQPACANDFLLKDTLRDKWGFKGYVVSDCHAIVDIQNGHHYVKTLAEATAVSLKAGMDNTCIDYVTIKTDNEDYVSYVDAVKQGLLTEDNMNVSLRRLFNARFALGMFDPPSLVKYAQTPDSENNSEAHRQLALKITRETMVLLKNDGTLPLSDSVKKILVVGPLADQTRVLEGNYHGTAVHYVTALDGIRKQFPNAQVTYEPGTSFLREPVPVQADALTHGDNEPGLKAEFFANKELTGTPLLTRVDTQINFDRYLATTMPQGMKQAFIRWTGYITPTESGTYQLGVNGQMERLSLDGKVLVDDMTAHPHEPKTAPVELEAGHRYAVKLEYLGGDTFDIRLIWGRVLEDPTARAVAAAKSADVVIGVVGITSDLEGEEMKVEVPGFSGGDRTSLDLPKQEEDLMEAMKATGKPLVAVLMSGSALSVNWLAKNANAIVEAWYSGEEGGTAIGETLSGANNPSGKLPITFYKGVDQLPAFDDYGMQDRTYRYFHGEPLYPFGYGLSYSKFTYSDLKLGHNSINAGDPLEVQLDVTNSSERDGDDVVELYIVPPQQPGNPLQALRGLQRVHVAKGKTEHVQLTVQPRDLSFVDLAGNRLIAAGAYKVVVGELPAATSSHSVTAPFTISGEQKLPE